MSTMTTSGRQNSRSSHRPQPRAPVANVTPEAIRTRAYEIFQRRKSKSGPGDQMSDWLQAEREIKELLRGEVLLKGDQE